MSRDRQVWLFNSAQFNGNPKWLFLHVLQHRPDIEAWWLADNDALADLVRQHGLPALSPQAPAADALMRRAGVYVVNQVKEVIPAPMTGIVLLNLWHGVGVKGIERAMNEGFLYERIAKKYITNNQAYHDTQLFLVSSPLMEEHFSRQVGLAERNLVRAGYPQNVRTTDAPSFASFDHDLRARQGLPPDTRIALFAPTTRRDSTMPVLRTAVPDVDRLVARLGETNTLLVIKMHPHQSSEADFVHLRRLYADEPRLLFWDNQHDLYEIFDQIDLAIVDYSSILYDLLASGVTQVVRYLFDYDDGNAVLADGLDYLGMSCGVVAASFADLLELLEPGRADVDAEEVSSLNKMFWGYSGPDDNDRIIEAALSFRVLRTDLPTLYSFDIFDTLIHRRGVEPVSVFHFVRQRASEHGGYPIGLIQKYIYFRMDAESTARRSRRDNPRLAASQEFEIAFDDIFAHLQANWYLDDEQVDRLRAWEIEGELASVVPNPERIAEVRALVDRGETVILLSDMYLPRETISAMLATADPLLAELPLYLSSDLKVQKSTRRLYLRAYADLEYDFAEWIHTGDNRHADINQAKALGIRTHHVVKPVLTKRGAALASYAQTYDGYLIARLFAERARHSPRQADSFAYSVASAFLVPYVAWVIDDALRRGFSNLCFISRDGFHLRAIADAIIAARGLDLTTQYLHGSRRAWRIAAQVDTVDPDLLSPFGLFATVSSVSTLLEVSCLDRDTAKTLVPGLEHLLDQESTSQADVDRLEAALGRSPAFHEHILRVGKAQRETVLGYLRQEIDPNQRTAFVEYWGRGYTQDCLNLLLAEAFGLPLPTHMYYARSIYESQGLSHRYQFSITGHPNLIAVEAMFANMPHGTVTGYVYDGGAYVPVIPDHDHVAATYEAFVAELPRFARDYVALPLLDRHAANVTLFRSALHHLRTHPTASYYVKFLAPLTDTVGSAGEPIEFAPAFGAEQLPIIASDAALRKLTRSIPMSLARSAPAIRAAYRAARGGAAPRVDEPPRRRSLPRRLRRLIATSLRRFRRPR